MRIKKEISTGIIFVVILLFSLLSTFLVVKESKTSGLLLIPVILGFSMLVMSLILPNVGYYLILIFAFFVSDIERVFQVESLTFIVDLFIFATFIGILLKKIITRERFWLNANHPIVYVYLIYILYTITQIFNPNIDSVSVSILMLRKWITLLLFFYASLQIMKTVNDIYKFLQIWLLLAFLTALYGCLQTWFGMPQYQLNYIFSNQLLVGLYKLDDGEFRKFSFLGDPKEYGLLLAATVLIPLIFLVNYKLTKLKYLINIILIVILILGMSYSGTRTANLMLIIGILFFILMTLSNIRALFYLVFFATILAFILYAPIYGNTTINRFRSTLEISSDASMSVRDANRRKIQPYILDHPFGGGLGTTGVLNIKNNPNHPLKGFPTDSGFLQAALEIGWLGLLIQCTVYFIIIKSGIRAFYSLKTSPNKTLVLAATVAIFSYVAAQYSQIAIGDVPGIFLFYGLVSIIIRIPQIEKEEKLRLMQNLINR